MRPESQNQILVPSLLYSEYCLDRRIPETESALLERNLQGSFNFVVDYKYTTICYVHIDNPLMQNGKRLHLYEVSHIKSERGIRMWWSDEQSVDFRTTSWGLSPLLWRSSGDINLLMIPKTSVLRLKAVISGSKFLFFDNRRISLFFESVILPYQSSGLSDDEKLFGIKSNSRSSRFSVFGETPGFFSVP